MGSSQPSKRTLTQEGLVVMIDNATFNSFKGQQLVHFIELVKYEKINKFPIDSYQYLGFQRNDVY